MSAEEARLIAEAQARQTWQADGEAIIEEPKIMILPLGLVMNQMETDAWLVWRVRVTFIYGERSRHLIDDQSVEYPRNPADSLLLSG